MKVKIGNYNKTSDRKIDVKIEKFDTWSCDHTLAYIILPALLQLRASKMGIPAEFADVGGADYEAQDSFDFYKDSHNEYFDKSVEHWNEVLNKMIWSFQQIVCDDWEHRYHHGKAEYDWVKTDQQFLNPLNGKNEDTFEMVDKNPGEHWLDMKGLRLHQERIQEGLELFGKYYQHLWD